MARLNLKAFANHTTVCAADVDADADADTDANKNDNDNDENDELPDLCTLLQRLSHQSGHQGYGQSEDGVVSSSVQNRGTGGDEVTALKAGEITEYADENHVGIAAKKTKKLQRECSVGGEDSKKSPGNGQEEKSPKRRQQRPLRPAHVNSVLLLPVERYEGAGADKRETSNRRGGLGKNGVAEVEKERIRKRVPSRISISSSSSSSSISSLSEEKGGEETTEDSSEHMSDFIVNDSASEFDEVEVPRIRIPKEKKRTSLWKDGRADARGIRLIPDGSFPDRKASPTKSISGQSTRGAGRRIYVEPGADLKLYET